MVGGKQGWVTGRGGRRRVGQDWEAKCRRPNNGQAASTDLPTPPEALVRSVNLFPFCSANIGPSICPGCAARLRDALPFTRNPYTAPSLVPSIFFPSSSPPPSHSFSILRFRSSCRSSDFTGREEREREDKRYFGFFFFLSASFPRYSFLSLWRDRYVFEFSNFFERYVVDGRVTMKC